MKTRCSKIRRQITAWPDLNDRERQHLREHTRDCADCRAELDATLTLFGQLDVGRQAYGELRYSGPRPRLRKQRALTPAEGIRTIPSRGFWRPLPVALAGGLFAVSLAGYLLVANQSSLTPTPAPITDESGEHSWKSLRRPAEISTGIRAVRPRAGDLRMPTAPKRPDGLRLSLPSRPMPPIPGNGPNLQPETVDDQESDGTEDSERNQV